MTKDYCKDCGFHKEFLSFCGYYKTRYYNVENCEERYTGPADGCDWHKGKLTDYKDIGGRE
jgi:hypothetical protein